VLGRILVGYNGQTIAERELTPGRFIIGRTPDNDLQIDSKYISRHHAQIITSLHTSVLEDLNSTNGIYVRSKRVRRRMLNDGDVVQIGQHEIMYFDERLSRTRVSLGDTEDDAVPMLHDVHGERGHAATRPDVNEDEDNLVPLRKDHAG
jgi:pSer/pThr/pTyr-binding forkhead associated (FHA) protein